MHLSSQLPAPLLFPRLPSAVNVFPYSSPDNDIAQQSATTESRSLAYYTWYRAFVPVKGSVFMSPYCKICIKKSTTYGRIIQSFEMQAIEARERAVTHKLHSLYCHTSLCRISEASDHVGREAQTDPSRREH